MERSLLSIEGPYRVAIHFGQKNDFQRVLDIVAGDNCYQLVGVISGVVTLYHDLASQKLIAPCALLFPPGRAHRLVCPAGSRWERLIFDVVFNELKLRSNKRAKMHKKRMQQPDPVSVWGCTPPVQVPTSQLQSCLSTLSYCGSLWWQDNRGLLLANARLNSWIAGYVAETMMPHLSIENPWFAKVLEIAEHRLNSNFTINGLAQALGISRETLRLRLAENSGESPGALLSRLRLTRACRTLTCKDLPLKQVAKLCGYGSQAAFCHAFKQRFGISPKEWRRRQLL